jgi:hypothetical protein
MGGEANPAPEAVETIRRAIAEDAYVFLDDDSDHFVAEAVLFGFAGALLQSFAKGFTEQARARSEGWGRVVADWLSDGIEHVLRRGADRGTQDAMGAAIEAEPLLSEARAVAAERSADEIDVFAAASEAALVEALRERQLTSKEAARVAAEVRRAAMEAIQGG